MYNTIVCLMLSAALCGCGGVPQTEQIPVRNNYLSITYDTDDLSVPDTEKMMNFYTYDLETEELTNNAQIPFASQYALGAVSLDDNKVYYTKRENNNLGSGDCLYSYDLTSKQEELLENENRAYNDIVPVNNTLLVSAVKNGNNPAVFDLSTHKFKYLYEINGYGEDKYICSPPVPFGYNVNTDKFLYVYADSKSHYDLDYRIGYPEDKTPIPYHVALISSDLENQEVYTFNNQEVQYATQIDDNQVLCVTTDHPFASGNIFAYMIDMKEKQITELDRLPMPKMTSVWNCYTLDKGKSFYVFGICEDGRSGVFHYDTQTDTVEDIILDTDSGHVVNFTLLNYR